LLNLQDLARRNPKSQKIMGNAKSRDFAERTRGKNDLKMAEMILEIERA
jgi:hypothetical protein